MTRWLVVLAPDQDGDPCIDWPGAHRHLYLDDGTLGIIMEILPPSGVYVPGQYDVVLPAVDPDRVAYDGWGEL